MKLCQIAALYIILAAFSNTVFSANALTSAFNQVGGELTGIANQAVGAYAGAANQVAGTITNAIDPTTGTVMTANPEQQMQMLASQLGHLEIQYFQSVSRSDNLQELQFLVEIMKPQLTFTQMFDKYAQINARNCMLFLLQQNLVNFHEHPQALAWAAVLDEPTFHRIMHFQKISNGMINQALLFAKSEFNGKFPSQKIQSAIALLTNAMKTAPAPVQA